MRAAHRYENLARFAREHEFPKVTAAAVQGWVKAGLLPLAEVAHTGFQQRRISEPPETETLLLELCRRRYGKPPQRDLSLLGLGMWLDGFMVPDDGVRRGLRHVVDLPGWLLSATRVADAEVADLVNREVYEERLGIDLVASPADLATGEAEVLRLMQGTLKVDEMSPDGIAALERSIGAPGFYKLVRAGELPVRLHGALARLAPAELGLAIDTATRYQLDMARSDAMGIGGWLQGLAADLPSPVPRDLRWIELARELRTDIGRGQLVVGLLVVPEAGPAFRRVLDRSET